MFHYTGVAIRPWGAYKPATGFTKVVVYCLQELICTYYQELLDSPGLDLGLRRATAATPSSFHKSLFLPWMPPTIPGSPPSLIRVALIRVAVTRGAPMRVAVMRGAFTRVAVMRGAHIRLAICVKSAPASHRPDQIPLKTVVTRVLQLHHCAAVAAPQSKEHTTS